MNSQISEHLIIFVVNCWHFEYTDKRSFQNYEMYSCIMYIYILYSIFKCKVLFLHECDIIINDILKYLMAVEDDLAKFFFVALQMLNDIWIMFIVHFRKLSLRCNTFIIK